jgi:hypothetical protein
MMLSRHVAVIICRFDRVFGGESMQEDVYEDVQTLIRSVMDGAQGVMPGRMGGGTRCRVYCRSS